MSVFDVLWQQQQQREIRDARRREGLWRASKSSVVRRSEIYRKYPHLQLRPTEQSAIENSLHLLVFCLSFNYHLQNNRATHLRNLARGLDGVGVAVLSDALLALFCDCYCALSSRLTLHPRGTSEQLCPSVFCFSFTKFSKTTFPDDGDNLFGQVQLVPNGLTFHYCYARSHFRPSVCFANHLLSVNLSLKKTFPFSSKM